MVVLGVKCRGGDEGPVIETEMDSGDEGLVIEIEMDSGGAGSKVLRG